MTGYEALHTLLQQYLDFHVQSKRVHIPYVLERSRFTFNHSSGKGTPSILLKELENAAERDSFYIRNATEYEIYTYMREKRIGVDCSGFVYHLLDAYTKSECSIPLTSILVRYPGILGRVDRAVLSYQRHRRISAKTLTSSLNTIEIPSISSIHVGDLIRMSVQREADHVLIVVDVNRDGDTVSSLTYAHSSSVHTQKRGPHVASIEVVDAALGLDSQRWIEQTKDGRSYVIYFHPERGDAIRRLSCLVS